MTRFSAKEENDMTEKEKCTPKIVVEHCVSPAKRVKEVLRREGINTEDILKEKCTSSVGKAEDDGKIFSDKDRSDKVMTPMGVDFAGNDNPASSAPKSEPCTHEPYWILWIEGENKLIHCSKCNGTWNIEKFAEEIRQQSRKETAKEILEKLKVEINDYRKSKMTPNEESLSGAFIDLIEELEYKYGVDA